MSSRLVRQLETLRRERDRLGRLRDKAQAAFDKAEQKLAACQAAIAPPRPAVFDPTLDPSSIQRSIPPESLHGLPEAMGTLIPMTGGPDDGYRGLPREPNVIVSPGRTYQPGETFRIGGAYDPAAADDIGPGKPVTVAEATERELDQAEAVDAVSTAFADAARGRA